MKKYLLILLLLFTVTTLKSQSLTGEWEGTISIPDHPVKTVFHIREDSSGTLNISFDIPSQNAHDIACNEALKKGDSLLLQIKNINGSFAGLLSADKKQIKGMLAQGKEAFPLDLTKTSNQPAARRNGPKRPQTPVPPFPYKSEEVIYENADKSIRYGATFTVPLPDSSVDYFRRPVYPAVLLVTGSGPQDRDETIFGHKPFAVLADFLTRNGIAVLRVDDRGMGKTTGRYTSATTADFAGDAMTSLDYLRSRREVDTNFIGLIGHSEGGIIAPLIASQRADIKFVVMLAGPAIKIIDLMEQQNADVLLSGGIPSEAVAQFKPLYKPLVTAILEEKDSSKIYEQARAVFANWRKDIPDSTVKKTTGVSDEKTEKSYLNAFIKQLRTPGQPWFRYFMQIDPASYLPLVKCPVLAINGEKDIQVAARPNLDAIKKIFKKSGNRKLTTKVISGCNHLFQHCVKCTVSEYGELEESFAPEALSLISNWIHDVIK